MKSALIKRGGTPPPLKGRELTALPNWPLTLLTGVEGSGKTWSALEAATSPLVGHAYAMEIGEGSLDPYGAIPGVLGQVTKLEHDGTYADMAGQLWAATEAPRVDGKPNLIVVDGMSNLWDLLINEQQEIADRRARKKGLKVADGEAEIHTDLWNAAKKRWLAVTDLLKEHDGPVIITARLNEVLIFEGGKPRRDGAKEWKTEAHKSTPFEVDVVLEAREKRKWVCTKVRSVKLTLEPDQEERVPNFTMDAFWRMMGLDETTTTSRRQVVALNADHGADEQEAEEAALQAQLAAERPGGAAEQQRTRPAAARRGAERPAERTNGMTAEQWKAEVEKAPTRDRLNELHAMAQQAGQLTEGLLGLMQTRAAELVKKAAEENPERPAEQPAEPASPEADPEEAALAEAEHRAMLVDELAMIAEIMGVTVAKLTERHLPKGTDGVPVGQLQEVVARIRPVAVAKLKQQKRTAEAAAYAKVKPDEYDIPSNLLAEPAAAAA